jgi:predicted metal-dependent HD superfamily phosphohydrolase
LVEGVIRLIHVAKDKRNGLSACEEESHLDADLDILGAPPNICDQDKIQVRHVRVTHDHAFRAGRCIFLPAARACPRPPHTDVFEPVYPAKARGNMQSEPDKVSI